MGQWYETRLDIKGLRKTDYGKKYLIIIVSNIVSNINMFCEDLEHGFYGLSEVIVEETGEHLVVYANELSKPKLSGGYGRQFTIIDCMVAAMNAFNINNPKQYITFKERLTNGEYKNIEI